MVHNLLQSWEWFSWIAPCTASISGCIQLQRFLPRSTKGTNYSCQYPSHHTRLGWHLNNECTLEYDTCYLIYQWIVHVLLPQVLGSSVEFYEVRFLVSSLLLPLVKKIQGWRLEVTSLEAKWQKWYLAVIGQLIRRWSNVAIRSYQNGPFGKVQTIYAGTSYGASYHKIKLRYVKCSTWCYLRQRI